MASFAEQLRSLSNPEPSRFDLDEDDFDLTRAQVINKGTDLGEIETQNVPSNSNLRKKTVALLQDEDKKYAGRKISRAELEAARGLTDGSDSEEGSEEDNDSEDDMQNGREISEDEDIGEENNNGIDDVNDDTDDDDDDDDDDEENDTGGGGVNDVSVQEIARKRNKHTVADDFDNKADSDNDESVSLDSANDENNGEYSGDNLDNDNDNKEDDDDDDDGELDEDAGGDAIQNFSTASLTDDIEKGTAAKNQLSLWDSFLEMRIRLQKALLVANKLPQHDQIEEFNSSGDKNLKDMYKQGRKAVAKLLGNLLLIQEKLLEQNPDTVNVLHPGAESNKSTAHGSDDDEEIPSDTEDEKSDNDDDNADDDAHSEGEQAEGSLKLPAKRKHELATSEYGEYISKRHAAFQSYRDATISKWSEKTRLASGKLNSKSFSSFNRSTLSQINHILSDKDRLIKRTQLKRTAYRVLGKSENVEKQNLQSKEEQSDIHLRNYDPEIFDDDDFYHQLLREFIEQRTSGSTGNPIEMGRQWLQLQKLRRKVKKKVDTKASKGRKIRYDIHGKLVSFMAPIEKGVMTDSSRNELFCSLFGAKQQETAADINVLR